MVDIGWADLEVRPDVSTFGSQLGRGLNGPLDSIGRSSGKRFGGILGKAAMGVAGGVLAAGYAAISIGKDAYAEAKEARKVGALTASTIKATGGAANISAKQVGKLSEAIMLKTAVDDEAIQTGANLLLTFKNVRNEVGKGNQIFNEATAAAVDLSAAGFGSVDSAAKMLGKTLNDPVKGITALSRAGVTFTEQQKTKIASLVEENDLLGAQKIILREVQSQVGGAAAAQADAGDKLGVVIGNIKEDIGTALMPTIDRFADWMSKKGPAAGRKFSGWLEDDAIPAIENFVSETRPLAEELLPAVGDALGTVKDVLKDAAPLVKDFVGAFNDMPDWAKKAIVGGALAGGAASKLGLLGGRNGGGLGGIVGSLKPTPVFVTNPGFGSGGLPGAPGGGKIPGGGKVPPVGLPGMIPILPALGSQVITPTLPTIPTGALDVVERLMELTNSADGSGLIPALYGADASELSSLNTVLEAEFGKGLRYLEKAGAIPEGFGAHFSEMRDQALGARSGLDHLYSSVTGVQEKTGKATANLRKMWEALPDKVQTEVLTPGLVKTRGDVIDLKKKYDLTPREVKTVLRAMGFVDARRQADDVRNAISLIRDKNVTVTTTYQTRRVGMEERFRDGGTSEKTSATSERTTVVINLPDGRQLDGYMDDRIHANEGLKGQRR